MKYLILFTLIGSYSCLDIGSDYKYSAKYNDGVDFNAFDKDDGYLEAYSKDTDWKDNDGYDTESYSKGKDWNKNDYRYSDPNVVGLERDDKEDIARPCSTDDWLCIRKFFAKNSNCKPMYGPVPDPLYFERNTFYLVYASITVVMTKLSVKGIASAKISEFYVNKDTGNLVFAIDFKDLNLTSPNTYFRYQRRAKESIVLNDFVTANINSGTFTAVIPTVPHMRLDLAEVHADIDDAVPPFVIGPKAVNQDPQVLASFARLLSDIPIAVQETHIFLAQLLTGIYIQKNICDFGLQFKSI